METLKNNFSRRLLPSFVLYSFTAGQSPFFMVTVMSSTAFQRFKLLLFFFFFFFLRKQIHLSLNTSHILSFYFLYHIEIILQNWNFSMLKCQIVKNEIFLAMHNACNYVTCLHLLFENLWKICHFADKIHWKRENIQTANSVCTMFFELQNGHFRNDQCYGQMQFVCFVVCMSLHTFFFRFQIVVIVHTKDYMVKQFFQIHDNEKTTKIEEKIGFALTKLWALTTICKIHDLA